MPHRSDAEAWHDLIAALRPLTTELQLRLLSGNPHGTVHHATERLEELGRVLWRRTFGWPLAQAARRASAGLRGSGLDRPGAQVATEDWDALDWDRALRQALLSALSAQASAPTLSVPVQALMILLRLSLGCPSQSELEAEIKNYPAELKLCLLRALPLNFTPSLYRMSSQIIEWEIRRQYVNASADGAT